MERLGLSLAGNVREFINVIGEGLVRSRKVRSASTRLPPTGPDASVPRMGVASLEAMCAACFRQALAACEGRVSGPHGTADLTGVKPNTLWAKLDKLGIPNGRKARERTDHRQRRAPLAVLGLTSPEAPVRVVL